MSDIYQENITGQVSSSASISGETKDTSPPFKIIFPCNSVAEFPSIGKENALYIDKSVNPNIAYRWDADESAYIMVGGAGGGGEGTAYAVQYVTQTLTETQQARARENISAAPAEHEHEGYAATNHTHEGYAAANHTHAELHTHTNRAVLEKFSESGGSLQYDGAPIAGGGGSGSVTVDSEITESSSNPVSSAAIFAALAAKSDKKVHLFKRSKQVLAEECAAGYSTDVLWQSDNAVGGGADDEYFTYDNETGFLTVKRAGKYLCVVQLRVAGTAEGYSSVFLDLNDATFENTPGVPYYLSTAPTYKYPSYPTHMSVVQLAAGDQLNARAKFTGKNGNTGVTYNLGNTAGFFTVMYLGE